MRLVNYQRIYCKCRKCGYEDDADRTSSNIFEVTDCPKCGEKTFSKKMYFPRNEKVEFIECKSKNKCPFCENDIDVTPCKDCGEYPIVNANRQIVCGNIQCDNYNKPRSVREWGKG